MRSFLLSSLLGLMTVVPGASSQLALWLFTGGDPIPVNTTEANVSAGDLSRNGVTPVTTNTIQYSATDWPIGAYGGGYFELSLTADDGFLIDYSTVTFHYVIGTNATFTTELVSSVDGYSSPLSSHVSSPGTPTYDDSLAVLGEQSGTVTFRLYGYTDNSNPAGLYAGNLSFNSAVEPVVSSTPEPSSIALLFGGGLALAIARRRRQSVR
jgi:hypothetical protein